MRLPNEEEVMKRFLTICMVLALAVLFASPAFAEYMSEKHFIKEVTVASSAKNGAIAAVSTSTVVPGKDFIIGYSICGTIVANEALIGLYDSTLANATTTTLFAEAESDGTESKEVWYPYPKKIATQLTIGQGANSIATVYYVRLIP